MHQLAIELASLGHVVSGSDDVVYDPSRGRLTEAGLLPTTEGWDANRITPELDAVIVGMHAKADNPELLRAKELGIKVQSFPQFVYEHAANKQRIVIAGSHGKTTITAMVMHVLRRLGRNFDYLVGAQVPGFERNVRLSNDAPVMLLEGDEYLCSPLDPRPKFLVYSPHILVLTGIAWDHINVFPTETDYVDSFRKLMADLTKAGMVVYNTEDERVVELVRSHTHHEKHYRYPYETPKYKAKKGHIEVKLDNAKGAVQVFGQHNMANLAAAYELCKLLAVDAEAFLEAMADFTGASMRLQKVHETDGLTVIRDFAHAPSKVHASLAAVREVYKKSNIIAALELHTFSSLNKDYVHQYAGTLDAANHQVVYINKEAMARKGHTPYNQAELQKAFASSSLQLVEEGEQLVQAIAQHVGGEHTVILLMSSATMAGLEPTQLVRQGM